MSDALKKMSLLYGKLGLQTNADIIEKRAKGAASIHAELESNAFPELIRSSLGMRL